MCFDFDYSKRDINVINAKAKGNAFLKGFFKYDFEKDCVIAKVKFGK